ncbi:MAG TPA: LysR family transcriptional regulator [Caulobacteraceae bacterium]|jgi:DNA-binding transcriptional LysR family regulator|nr:LysR family transcriptional regulator [Caulobacteraceae bacterium]
MNRSSSSWQWDDVRFFLEVARAGSLSAAARTLGVGHVTVGRRIALMEARLGVTLLNRTPDGFVTTPAGDAILTQCMTMEEAAFDLERIAAGSDSLLAGSIRVTTTEAMAAQTIAPAIITLRQIHPDLQVELIAGVRSLDIARREADLAVRLARPRTPDLVCQKLGDVGFALYASPRYLETHGSPEPGRGLGGHDLIAYTGAPPGSSPFFMGESLEGARFALRCDSPFVQRKAAEDGLGFAELACFLGDASETLERVWPLAAPSRRTAWLVFHRDMRRSARVAALATAIRDTFRRQRKQLENGDRGS